jgi:cytochrome c
MLVMPNQTETDRKRMPVSRSGIADPQARRELIDYLKRASPGNAQIAQQGNMGMGGMMGGMSGERRNLKMPEPAHQVQAIRQCRDTYHVVTTDGETHDFWEPNLRFKTDSSDLGPPSGRPALLPAGMMGDRADVIFAKPEEMSTSIKHEC